MKWTDIYNTLALYEKEKKATGLKSEAYEGEKVMIMSTEYNTRAYMLYKDSSKVDVYDLIHNDEETYDAWSYSKEINLNNIPEDDYYITIDKVWHPQHMMISVDGFNVDDKDLIEFRDSIYDPDITKKTPMCDSIRAIIAFLRYVLQESPDAQSEIEWYKDGYNTFGEVSLTYKGVNVNLATAYNMNKINKGRAHYGDREFLLDYYQRGWNIDKVLYLYTDSDKSYIMDRLFKETTIAMSIFNKFIIPGGLEDFLVTDLGTEFKSSTYAPFWKDAE